MNIRNFEVIVDDLEKNPHCLHGPTLIFRKNDGKINDYYACSACRDHKFCSFRIPVNEKKNKLIKSSNFWKEEQKKILTAINESQPEKTLSEILCTLKKESISAKKNNLKNLEDTELYPSYCYSCSCLFKKHDCTKHINCNVLSNLTYYQLNHPTSFIIPKTNSKIHAQYFFSETTVKDIVTLLLRLKTTKILCIGVPKIHEYVLNNFKNKIGSLLLDFDKSYFNFYNKNQFIWYNMFNNYIFDEKQEDILNEFLQSGKIVVLIDPPFGGRVEPLARTLAMLNKTFDEVNKNIHEKGKLNLNTFWFFPYFMEQHLKSSLPDFKMFDYKVNYENHSSFTDTGNKKRKFGSPVRIFTNIPLSNLNLNGVSGYKYCGPCGYWVANENKHCEECNACTSKNGRTYIHCSICTKCVKPSYKHCDTCSRCCLPDHVCGEFQPDVNCYHCHQPGHKKRECVFLSKKTKRRLSAPDVIKQKKKEKLMYDWE